MTTKKNILITGTSSGIGEACVQLLAQKNFRIFACVRNHEDFEKWKRFTSNDNVFPIFMELNDNDSIEGAIDLIKKEIHNDGLYALINNAAVARLGAVEYMSMDSFKEQFEVNLFAQIKLTQICLPLLRKGYGRIINISSNNGYISMPFMGGYCATKFALEAISDALRIELKPWKIPVIVINPDKIKSSIWKKTITASNEDFKNMKSSTKELYGSSYENFLLSAEALQNKALPASIVARTVMKSLVVKYPKPRYLPDFESKLTYIIYRLASKKFLNRLIYKEIRV